MLKINIKWPSSTMVKKHANEVLSFHNMQYVVCTIHQSAPIPIITQLHVANYYNKKRFHSIILQGIIVTNKCIFWDFDIKWVSSMHDANMEHTLQFKKIVRLEDLYLMFWLEMQHTHVIHGCSCHSRGVKMGSPMGNIIGILFNVPHGCVWNVHLAHLKRNGKYY